MKALEDRFRTVFVGFTAPLGGSFVNYDLDRFNGGNRLQLNQVFVWRGTQSWQTSLPILVESIFPGIDQIIRELPAFGACR